MSNWIEPTAVGALSLIAAGGATYLFRHIGAAWRLAVRAVIDMALTDFKVELDKRFDHNDQETEDAKKLAAELKLELATQFGGNGNGIRQAVNAQTAELATLRGAFDQHILETGK